MKVPSDFPVRQLRTKQQKQRAKDLAQCLTCGRFWDDGIVTGSTPTPAARCPFEYFHDHNRKGGLR